MSELRVREEQHQLLRGGAGGGVRIRKDTGEVLQDGDVPDVVVEGVHGVVAVKASAVSDG